MFFYAVLCQATHYKMSEFWESTEKTQ